MKVKSYSLELSVEAENDFNDSYEYYFSENPKIADTFFQYINSSLGTIQNHPYNSPESHKKLRKFLVKKFPFVIYYQVVDDVIRVIAIFHTSRNPQIWAGRIAK